MTRVEDKHIDIDSVKVNGRVRKDLGDLEPLKKSIVDRGGLLHPIVVAPDQTLICGARRLEACRQLGWRSMPVTFKDDPAEAHQVEAERIATESDENTCRLDMKPSERVALGKALEEIARPEAARRRSEGNRRGAAVRDGDLTRESRARSRTKTVAEKAAEAVGMGDYTYRHAKEVVERAEQGDPQAIEALKEMDSTGQVEPAYRHVTGTPKSTRPITVETKRQRQVAGKRKQRLAKGLYGLEGICAGLDETDLRYVWPLTDREELAEWDHLLGKATKTLREFRRKLKEGSA